MISFGHIRSVIILKYLPLIGSLARYAVIPPAIVWVIRANQTT